MKHRFRLIRYRNCGGIVEVIEGNEAIVFRLYHCKYSGGSEAGARVKDPAEVCAQAVRSVRWTTNPKRLLEHLRMRERDHKSARPTRFEKGDLRYLANLKRRLRKLKSHFEIVVVQPGISKQACTPELSTMLGAADNLVSAMTGVPMKVIASK